MVDFMGESAAIQFLNGFNFSDAAISLPRKTLLDQYAEYIASLAPVLWLRFREVSGTNVANSGSMAAVGTFTPGVGAVGQAGLLGANEAYDFDGADSKVQFANADVAALKALTTQRSMILCFLDNLGEASVGFLWTWGVNTSHVWRINSTNRMFGQIDTDGTNAAANTNNNEISDCIGVWRLFFMDYDDTDAMGLGRKIRFFKSVPGSGVVTPLTLATDTAATGTVVEPSADYAVGNTTSQIFTFNGRIDELIHTSGLWTPANAPTDYSAMETISRLTPA